MKLTSVSVICCMVQFLAIVQCKPESQPKPKVRLPKKIILFELKIILFKLLASSFHKSRTWSEQGVHEHEYWTG